MGSGGPLPSGQRRWLTLYYARHTWAEVDAQDLPAAMTNDPDAFPSKPRRRAGGSDSGDHHGTRSPQRRRRLGGDAARPSSQNARREDRPPVTFAVTAFAASRPRSGLPHRPNAGSRSLRHLSPNPTSLMVPIRASGVPQARGVRNRGENRGRRVALACAHLRRPRRLWLLWSSYLFGTVGASLPSRKIPGHRPTLPRRKTTKALRFPNQLR